MGRVRLDRESRTEVGALNAPHRMAVAITQRTRTELSPRGVYPRRDQINVHKTETGSQWTMACNPLYVILGTDGA